MMMASGSFFRFSRAVSVYTHRNWLLAQKVGHLFFSCDVHWFCVATNRCKRKYTNTHKIVISVGLVLLLVLVDSCLIPNDPFH